MHLSQQFILNPNGKYKYGKCERKKRTHRNDLYHFQTDYQFVHRIIVSQRAQKAQTKRSILSKVDFFYYEKEKNIEGKRRDVRTKIANKSQFNYIFKFAIVQMTLLLNIQSASHMMSIEGFLVRSLKMRII